jgi:hypothetical protein
MAGPDKTPILLKYIKLTLGEVFRQHPKYYNRKEYFQNRSFLNPLVLKLIRNVSNFGLRVGRCHALSTCRNMVSAGILERVIVHR